MKSAIFTIAAKNYLPCVRVLMSSIRQWHPELLRVVILVDQIDGYFNPEEEDFDIVLSEDLNLPQSDWFHFKYTILEFSTAVKPYAIELLFRKYNLDRIIYLDPDIKIYNRLDCLLHSLERCSILLTPHLTDTLDDGRHPGELDILRSGSYNLGFIGLSFTEESKRFLKWWQARLYEHCVVDLDRGLFVDQRWVDLVPGLFSGVVINRRPGMNVAYWNLAHRRVLEEAGRFTVNGEPLYFFHFSGFDAENPMEFSKHQNRFRLSDLGDAALIVAEYRDELLAQGYQQCRHWPYAYGQFENGFPIPDMGRPVHHESPRLLEEVADTFSVEGLRAFLAVWNGPIDGPGGEQPGVTRLAYRIYRSRYDVQAAMPDVLGPDRVRFLEWMLSSGKREHRLNEVLLAPVWDALEAAQRSQACGTEVGRPAKISSSRNVTTGLDEAVEPVGGVGAGGRQKAVWQHLSEESQNAFVEADCGPGTIRLTGLTRAIYESRADLQRSYPNLTRETGIRLLIWILTYGKREYGLDGVSLEPLKKQWRPALLLIDKPLVRLRYSLLLAATKVSVGLRTSVSFIPLRFSRLKARWYLRKYSQRVRRYRGRPAHASVPRAIPAPLSADAPKSVNLIGYVRSEMGIGESARLAALAARSAGILVRLRSVDEEDPYRRLDDRAGPVSEKSDGYFSIFHVNADQTSNVFARLMKHSHADRYDIGYWAWELSEFPDRWAASFQVLPGNMDSQQFLPERACTKISVRLFGFRTQ